MGLATSGGRVAIVGVGGLVLGGMRTTVSMLEKQYLIAHPGGISFFSPRYGFDCDNVVNFEASSLKTFCLRSSEC